MNKVVVIVIFVLASSFLNAQKFQWAKHIGSSTGADEITALTTTKSDTVIGAGFFEGTLPSGSASATGGRDVYVRATKKDGSVGYNPLHFITTGGNDAINDMTSHNGFTYVTGKLHGSSTVSNGTGTISNTFGNGSYFVAKIDRAGHADWVAPNTNTVLSEGMAITADLNGDLYVAGVFRGKLKAGTDSVESVGVNNDIFIIKYNSSGVAQWIRSVRGTGAESIAGLKYDAANSRIILVGNFSQTIRLSSNVADSLSPNSAGTNDVFVAAYNASGTLGVKTRPYFSGGNIIAEDLAIHPNNQIFIGGGFTASIGDGSSNFNSSGGQDIFIGRLNSTTLLSNSLKRYGGVNSEKITQLTIENSILFGFGEFASSLSFGTYSATANSTSDIFLVSWNSGLTEYSANGGVAGQGSNVVTPTCFESAGDRLYFGGKFRRIANFRNAGTFTAKSISFFDGYLASAKTLDVYCAIETGIDSSNVIPTSRVDSNLICFGDTAVLISQTGTGFTYQWHNSTGVITGATSKSLQVLTSDTLHVVITDVAKSCSVSSDTIIISRLNQISPIIFDTVLCVDAPTINMRMNPAFSPGTATLSGSAGINPGTNQFLSRIAGVGSDTIVYRYTDPVTGCSESDSAVYEVRGLPVISFANVPVYCQSDARDTLNMASTANPMRTVYYSMNSLSWGIEDSVVFRADSLPAFPSPGHEVIYHAIDSFGCENSAKTNIIINPKPNVVFNFSPPNPFCANTLPFAITGGNQTGGVYFGAAVDSLKSEYSPSLAPAVADTIYYKFKDNNGCSDTVFRAFSIDTVPVVKFLFTSKVCSSDSLIELTGGTPKNNGVGVYKSPWVSSGNFFPRLSGVGTHPVNYVFQDNNGCKDSVVTNVVVNSLPGVGMAPLNPICENEKSIVITGGSPTGGSYILRGNVLTGDILDPTKYPPLPGGAQDSIVYSFTDTNNCTATASTSLLIRRLDGIIFSPVLNLNRLCNNDSIDLYAMGDTLFSPPPASGGYFLDENGDSISIFSGKKYLPLSSDTSKLSRLQYIYNYSSTGCADTATEFIRISFSPEAKIKPVEFACAGIDFEIEAEGGVAYRWDNDSLGSKLSIVQDSATKYAVTVTNINGCEDSASIVVSLSNGSIISAKGTTTTLKKGENVSIDLLDIYPADTVALIGEISVVKKPANALDFYAEQGKKQDVLSKLYYEPDPEFRRVDTVNYKVCDVVCTNVCDSINIYFKVLGDPYDFIPNGFSPNGDGLNDTWVIPGIEAYPENELYIYNRWGDLIYEAAPYINEWTGQANKGIGGSDKIGDGIFFYVLITNDGDPIKGTVEMKSN